MTLRSLSALAAALGLIISTAAFAQSGSSGGSAIRQNSAAVCCWNDRFGYRV